MKPVAHWSPMPFIVVHWSARYEGRSASTVITGSSGSTGSAPTIPSSVT